ncbi:NAD-dependent succinate-semialdehyde dehydrogenase [Hydrogenophaga sp. OTU3427]|uniref:NAD-dependent succinate-semialdehyde dehydrogenase n=1 Tax=Hydrogenophaga sp. OTU3427 TaxID=3043856 RepID=UPI00313D71BD
MNINTNENYVPPMQFIAGRWRTGGDGVVGMVVNPANDEVLAEIPRASKQDLDDALAAAQNAFSLWRMKSAHERAAVLRRAAALLRERVSSIAMRMTLEQGKTLPEARLEVELSAETFDWYAAEALRVHGRVMPSRVRGARQMVLPQPLGPVAAFTPWNFPALLPARKIAPALAAGCTMVMKPSEETPSSALALAEALADAGLPAGVLNMVLGVPAEVSAHLIASPAIRKVTFTGSTEVGRTLARLAAEGVKPCTLELGGHAPVLIFDDADLERTVATCITGKTRNAGQVCTSPTRFLVQAGVYDRFVAAFSQAMNRLVIGDGMAADSQMGPLANRRRLKAVEDMVNGAVGAGAKVLAGGERQGSSGSFFRPTVLVGTPPDATVMRNEPFGPLALVDCFDSLEEGLALANNTPYGLAAYAFTRSAETAVAVSEGLEAGGIGINSFAVSHIEAPFGGLKDSGYGHEGGSEGLEAFMHQKYVHHA